MIELIRGDICRIEVDAIVNAANSRLAGGGGVDGAIHREGGPSIMQECDQIRESQAGCPTGEAVITTAGNLPAQYVIHTVGPIWHGGDTDEPEYLARAYRSSLGLANKYELGSISFPNISTGVYGFPKDLAAQVAIDTVREFLENNPIPNRVVFVCLDDENFTLYRSQIG